eukprot:507620_1
MSEMMSHQQNLLLRLNTEMVRKRILLQEMQHASDAAEMSRVSDAVDDLLFIVDEREKAEQKARLDKLIEQTEKLAELLKSRTSPDLSYMQDRSPSSYLKMSPSPATELPPTYALPRSSPKPAAHPPHTLRSFTSDDMSDYSEEQRRKERVAKRKWLNMKAVAGFSKLERVSGIRRFRGIVWGIRWALWMRTNLTDQLRKRMKAQIQDLKDSLDIFMEWHEAGFAAAYLSPFDQSAVSRISIGLLDEECGKNLWKSK